MKNIKIVGARVNNLKNITVEIPKEKITVITGLSGSGKSSLAFDTIFAEGQRRYVESLSNYARQFLTVLEKPDFDYIEGLAPAIAIDQKSAARNPRSTVGTMTEIYDFLRLLFARIGVVYCPICGQKMQSQTTLEILEQVKQNIEKNSIEKFIILAPIISRKKGEHKYTLNQLKKNKFDRIRFDGIIMDIDEGLDTDIDKNSLHNIEVEIDRFDLSLIKDQDRKESQLDSKISQALDAGNGSLIILNLNDNSEKYYSRLNHCPKCEISLPKIEPSLFSFNNPEGACEDCQGLGMRMEVDPDLVMPNANLTINEGAIRPWSRTTSHANWYQQTLIKLAKAYNFSLDIPIVDLSETILKIILYGDMERKNTINFEGVIPNLERRYRETDSDYLRQEIEKYMIERICPSCNGMRLKKEVLAVKIEDKNIVEVTQQSIEDVNKYFARFLKNNNHQIYSDEIVKPIVKEIISRIDYLLEVGVSYLSLDRGANTLAGGEAQRIRLATQLGSGLSGIVYILDEPSIGLHPADHHKLLTALKKLKDLGNTLIIVEHDKETMLAADYMIDVGPGAGDQGGKIVASGKPEEFIKSPKSLTGYYLSGKKQIKIPQKRRNGQVKSIIIKGASAFNLKDINAEIPLEKFVCITGVSGSGKSTLINEILAKALSKTLHRAHSEPGEHKEILGIENIDKVINIDQSPIGRTPRSNPATFTGVFTFIRDLFANLADAKEKHLDPSKFSFNLKGGRCEVCRGDGVIKVEMNFLPDVYVKCQSCLGLRYNEEVLSVFYKGKNISDVLNMTINEARVFFDGEPNITVKLDILIQVGLGYLKLGQPATNLSGGEAQRIKLATELARTSTGQTLYILDEPTTGLHFEDIDKLLLVLQALVDKGNSVVVIEHNLDVIKSADWIIDMGPEGGIKGGEIIAQGPPEEIVKNKKSLTGAYLKEELS